jgi:hypothetical protein
VAHLSPSFRDVPVHLVVLCLDRCLSSRDSPEMPEEHDGNCYTDYDGEYVGKNEPERGQGMSPWLDVRRFQR